MKYYKKINNKFEGFYDEEINSEQLFDITYEDKIIEVEVPETSISPTTKTPVLSGKKAKRTISIPIKTLKPNFYKLTDDKWQELLNGQSEGKEIRILKTGELGLYTLPKMPEGLVKPAMNYDTDIWEEQATPEERQAYWREEIIKVNSKIRTENDIFGGASKELTDKLNKYIEYHKIASQEIVNSMSNFNGTTTK